jgi:hypothetical protein
MDILVKKILVSFLTVVFSFSPLINWGSNKVYAQSLGGSAQSGWDIQGIGAVAANCVDMAGMISDGISSLGSLVGVDTSSGVSAATAAEVAEAATSVAVKDAVVRKEEKKANQKERCLDAIARYAVLKVIDKITLETVRWINTGFQGNPFYLESPEQFFGDIARDEIAKVNAWYTIDPENYPFGRVVMETILLSLQRQFSENVRFSLNQVLAHGNYEQFRGNFSVGGWAGYVALSNPNNNPFGNYVLLNGELGRRTAGTSFNKSYTFKQQLEQGAGFLNQQECVLTAAGPTPLFDINNDGNLEENIYIEENDEEGLHVFSGQAPPQAVYDVAGYDPNSFTPITESQQSIIQYYTLNSICDRWVTKTPGTVVANSVTDALGSPLRQLELADELNENLGLIFDALLNQLVTQGLNSLSNLDNDPASPTYNVLYDQYTGGQPGAGSQGQGIGDVFNGTQGGDPGIVDIQQSYVAQATTNINLITNQLIMPTRLLDYCVPGPNPLWNQTAYTNLTNHLATLAPAPYDPDPQVAEDYYRDLIEDVTDMTISATPLIDTHQEFLNFMGFVFNKYENYMLNIYSTTQPMPNVRPQLANLYNQIPTYEQEIELYQNRINTINSLLPQLLSLETDLLALPDPNDTNDPQVQAILSVFAQLANQGLVNATQLAEAEARVIYFNGQSTYVENAINSCITEITGTYPYSNTRVLYPYDSSISTHPDYGSIPSLNPTFFTGNVNFNDTPGTIDVSAFGGGINVSSASSGTGTFESILQTVY